jgi:hypothetical protein
LGKTFPPIQYLPFHSKQATLELCNQASKPNKVLDYELVYHAVSIRVLAAKMEGRIHKQTPKKFEINVVKKKRLHFFELEVSRPTLQAVVDLPWIFACPEFPNILSNFHGDFPAQNRKCLYFSKIPYICSSRGPVFGRI